MGSKRMNRMKGAQTAIEAVVTDSAFLQTANFGYGYWNAGEKFCKGGKACLLYTSPSPRDVEESRMPSSA